MRSEAKVDLDGNNFFKLFKISNSNMKIFRSCKKPVDLFKSIKEWFDRERTQFPQNLQADLAFEFQAFMNNQIVEAQKAVSEENRFTFLGIGAENEAGHVANMTNQLRAVLYDIRIETMRYAKNQDLNNFRRCNRCGEVWTLGNAKYRKKLTN